MTVQQNQIVQPTMNGTDIFYRTPVQAIITDGMSLDDYIRNTTGVVGSGSNANGSYVKLADGTLVCYGEISAVNVPAGTGAYGLVTLPVSMYDSTYKVFTKRLESGAHWATVESQITDKIATSFRIRYWNNSGNDSSNKDMWVAVGRWKDYDVSVLPDETESTIINSSIGTWDYQSSEHVIGIHDGRPLYRRTYKTGSLPNAQGTYYYSSGLSTECVAVNCYGMIRPNSGTSAYYFPINCGERFSTYFRQTDSNICIQINQDRSSFFAEVTVEYFKTTDAIITSQTKDILTVVNGRDISNLETIIQQRVNTLVDETILGRVSIVTGGPAVLSGRKVDGHDEYVIRVNCGNMPNNTSKSVSLPFSLANVAITRPVTLVGQSSQNEYPIMQTGITWFISTGSNPTSSLTITTTSDRSRFTCCAEIYYYYK